MLPIFSRTPVATAQAAATIDELSGGRMVLGLGVSHQVTVENWFDSKITKPVTQMREYAADRARDPARRGRPRRASTSTPSSSSWATSRAPDLPIYVGGLSPNMLRLAGEIGDGVMLWLCNPDYIRDVVVPEVAEGARARRQGAGGIRHRRRRAGRGSPTTARPPARRCASELVTYFSLPFYRAMLERSGFGDDIEAFDEGDGAGRRRQGQGGDLGRLLDALAGIGSAEEVRAADRALPRRGSDLALHRRDPGHRLRGGARGRRRAALGAVRGGSPGFLRGTSTRA